MWKKMDLNESKLISYSGSFPKKLYRYRTVSPENLDRIINFEIKEEAIYLAGLKDLNDPDEGRFLIKFTGSEDEIFEFWRESVKSTYPEYSPKKIDYEAKLRTNEVINAGYIVPQSVVSHTRHVFENVLRVACFTTLPVNYSMWANYAKYLDPEKGAIDHGGICLEYECDKSWMAVNLHPVEYSDKIPEIDVVKRMESELINAIYMKSLEWRCEEEWRIMSVINAKPPFPENLTKNSKIRLENSITSVIFGLNTPEKTVKDIRDRVSKIKPTILFKQVIHNPMTYVRELKELKT